MERASDPLTIITMQHALINVLFLRFVEPLCKCSTRKSKPFVKGGLRALDDSEGNKRRWYWLILWFFTLSANSSSGGSQDRDDPDLVEGGAFPMQEVWVKGTIHTLYLVVLKILPYICDFPDPGGLLPLSFGKHSFSWWGEKYVLMYEDVLSK